MGRSGIIFGIINIIGNFGTVFVDQSYWQGAIAAKPAATYKGYLLGGIAWFSIPFSMATTLGLAGRAFDLPITMDESGSGLVPPAVAIHLLGPGGAFLVTFQLFMAVTATGSSEQIAVSSLFVYDVYKRYFNPTVTGKQIIFISRIMIAVWGVVSGVLAIILLELKINLGWVYQAMGNFIGSAVVPIVFALMWKDCTANGIISVATLGNENAFLGANIAALFSSPIFAFIVSAIEGFQNYDFEELNKTTETYLIEEDRHAHKDTQMLSEDSPEAMDIAYTWTVRTGSLMTFVLIVAWPLLALPQYSFSKSYFGFWVAIAFIWGHAAAVITIILPIWESREFLLHLFGIKKMDFSATARERPDYQPDGSVALREVKMDTAPMPMMAGSPQMMPMATMPMGGSPVMGMPMGGSPQMMGSYPMGGYPAMGMPMGAPMQ